MPGEQLPHRYYVTYTALNSGNLVRGEIDIGRAWPITDFGEVARVADLIQQKNPEVHSVVIAAWQRYEEVPA